MRLTDLDPLEEIAQKLEAIESRLARSELKLDRAIAALRPGLIWKLRPKHSLWRFRQHPPRPVSMSRPPNARNQPKQWPRVGIVTPSFNQAHFIGDTVTSVLSQEYPNLYYWVQDAGSTDGTLETLETFGEKLSWKSEPDDGQAQAINRGFAGTDCEIMAYLNSDDVLLPNALAYVVRYFADHPDVDVIYGHRVNIDEEGFEIGRAVLPKHDSKTIKWADYIPQETMFWRRKVWDELDGIDESFRFAMDWDFILRAEAAGFRFERVPRFLACFRVHESQKSSAMAHVGEEEMTRLRLIYLGRVPSHYEIRETIKPYLKKQILQQAIFRLKLRRY